MPATTELSGLDSRALYNSCVPPLRHHAGGVAALKFHLVWCPKYRRPVLVGEVADRLKCLLFQKAADLGATVYALEVMPDHVHLFVESRSEHSPAHLAAQFKGVTSHVLRAEFPHLRSRLPTLWSRYYFVASVGYVTEAAVKRYIETQWERP
jgi:putative transposase